MAKPCLPAARSGQSLGAVGGSIEIAAPWFLLPFGASCRATRGVTGTSRSQFKPCIFALLSLFLVMPRAHAAVVLERLSLAVGLCGNELCKSFVINENSPPFTSEFNHSVSAGGEAQHMTVVNVIPESGILKGASGSSSIVDPGMSATAGSNLVMDFTVSDNPASVSLHIETTGTSPGVAAFSFIRLDPVELLFRHPETPNFSGTFSGTFEGELDVGRYQFNIVASGPGMNAGLQSWEFDLDFPLRWLNPVDGNFVTAQ